MNCSEFKKNLHYYAENKIKDSLRESADFHLKECDVCFHEFNSLKKMLNYMTQMPVPAKSQQQWQEMNLKICSEIKQISNLHIQQSSDKHIFSFSSPYIKKWAIAALILISTISVFHYFFSGKTLPVQKNSAIQDISLLKVIEVQGQAYSDYSSDSSTRKSIDINNCQISGKTLSTAAGSSLRLQTDDKSFLEFAEKTALRVNECSQKKQTFTLMQGTVTAQVNKRESGQIYHINTPNATCEVVGTRFSLSFKENSDQSKSQTTLHVLEGKVLFRNAHGLTTMVNAGSYAIASFDTIIKPSSIEGNLPEKQIRTSIKADSKIDRKNVETQLPNNNYTANSNVLSKASALIDSGNLDQAISELRKILTNRSITNSIRLSAMQKEARCWKMKKNFPQSIKILQQILSLSDSDDQKGSALFQIASMQRSEMHDFDAAINYYNRYITEFPQGIWAEEASITLAELYQLQKDYQKASDLYLKIVLKYPKSIRLESVLYSLARIYSRDMQDCNRALNIYSQIESQFPNSNFAEDALFWKAECLFQLKRISQSVALYQHYLNKYPNGKWVTEAQIRSGFKETAGNN